MYKDVQHNLYRPILLQNKTQTSLFTRIFCRLDPCVVTARAVLKLIFVRNGWMSLWLGLDIVDVNNFITFVYFVHDFIKIYTYINICNIVIHTKSIRYRVTVDVALHGFWEFISHMGTARSWALIASPPLILTTRQERTQNDKDQAFKYTDKEND